MIWWKLSWLILVVLYPQISKRILVQHWASHARMTQGSLTGLVNKYRTARTKAGNNKKRRFACPQMMRKNALQSKTHIQKSNKTNSFFQEGKFHQIIWVPQLSPRFFPAFVQIFFQIFAAHFFWRGRKYQPRQSNRWSRQMQSSGRRNLLRIFYQKSPKNAHWQKNTWKRWGQWVPVGPSRLQGFWIFLFRIFFSGIWKSWRCSLRYQGNWIVLEKLDSAWWAQQVRNIWMYMLWG